MEKLCVCVFHCKLRENAYFGLLQVQKSNHTQVHKKPRYDVDDSKIKIFKPLENDEMTQ